MMKGILPGRGRPAEVQQGGPMDIAGVGTQVVDCLRVRKLIDRHGEVFLSQVYTPREMTFCRDRAHSTEHYAAVWAAKEAVFRSLGTTWRKGTAWTDVEVLCDNPVEPAVVVTGATKDLLDARGVRNVHLSMAHCRAFATATAIAVRG
jgi:holo-[acyl-carrier protein] synthase